jgi:hypothetical protein
MRYGLNLSNERPNIVMRHEENQTRVGAGKSLTVLGPVQGSGGDKRAQFTV